MAKTASENMRKHIKPKSINKQRSKETSQHTKQINIINITTTQTTNNKTRNNKPTTPKHNKHTTTSIPKQGTYQQKQHQKQ